MPKTRKLSYAKRKERRNTARRSSIINDNNNSDNTKPTETVDLNSQQAIEISDNDVGINVQDRTVVRTNRERIRDCILNNNRELDDTCINAFLNVISINTAFEPQDPLFYQGTHWYQRVETDKDIQIIYSGDVGANQIGHWTCVYYDGSIVHVYDTLHRKLIPLQEEILKYLYKEYSIVYENVQRQPDGVSCGVFACAIAVSLAQGTDPTTVRYLIDHHGDNLKSTHSMRHHLCKILDQETLMPFPTMVEDTSHIGQQGSGVAMVPIMPNRVESEVQLPSRKTYASVCRTVSQKTCLDTRIASNSYNVDKGKEIRTTNPQICDTVGRNENPKKKWWRIHKEKINQKRRNDYLAKQTARSTDIGDQYVVRNYVKRTEKILESDLSNCITTQLQQNVSANEKLQIRNAKKRINYAADAENIRSQKKVKYTADPETKKNREKEKYAANPENKKAYEKTKYALNPHIKNAIEKERYVTKSDVRKKNEKDKYTADPEIKKNYEKIKYIANPEIKKNYEKIKYTADPEIKKNYEKIKYTADPEMKKNHEKTKYMSNPEMKKEKNKRDYHVRREKKKERQLKFIGTNKIVKKYRNIGRRGNTISLLGSVDKYINLLTSKLSRQPNPQSRIEAEKIIKWCIQTRKSVVHSVKNRLTNLKNRLEVCIIRSAESLDIESKIAVFCGEPKHTGSTEAYYADTAYKELDMMKDRSSLMSTTKGQVVNILPTSASTHLRQSWVCSDICVSPDARTVHRLEQLLQAINSWKMTNIRNNIKGINKCSANNSGIRLGHSQGCYTNPISCDSKLLPLQILQPHYPQIRYFLKQIYEIIRLITKLNNIDNALIRGDLKILREISSDAALNACSRQSCPEGIGLNEDELIAGHPHAFQELTKRSMDVPESPCVSCEKLCYRRDVSDIKKLRKPLTGGYWVELQKYVNDSGCVINFICHYCLDKFRKNMLPPTCILNQLRVKETPAVISTLNDYERILIQRAKAFQTVQKMGTVSQKNLPRRYKIQKVKGRTFHLPLPLEETFKKLPSPTDALNTNQELFVMVFGIPNKSNVVWSNLVDVKKVYAALVWLKQNNPLYSEIELPAEPAMLLESLPCDVEIQIEPQQSNEEDCTELPIELDGEQPIGRRAILTQIVDNDEYCEQYTICPINAARVNKSATALYQMLKVQEPALNTWDKHLDVMCFPDLYPYGNNGQREDRHVNLRECDFIKSRLLSKHSAFRLNQQYLFFALHDSNIRQLKSGIFHKMNVINAKQKWHAETYLEMMSKGLLEGNLTTVFARLRNTDQYWRKARSMLACMVHQYGPATWFLTLSPSEWMWNDLAEYIRRVNGENMARMSTSELVATDPVSASRYIDNKFGAMLKFICSTDKPIGEVAHYFWRREYQGRGTQHFHLLIWIKDAPTIGESSTDEVTEFISKYVTCRIPDERVSPTLHRRVTTHQRHAHNDYCLRNKKTKKGYSRVCRFGFPRPITDSLILRDVAVSIAGRKQLKSKSRLYDLPRSTDEAFINDYNPVVLTAWEGNMDIQFIGDKSTMLTWYCTKYTTKTESSVSVEMFNDINSTKSLSSRLWSVTTRSLDNRECGALEAADTLLGISLYGTDPGTTIKWLDVNQVRNKRVKPQSVVVELDPKSTDIFYPSLIDDHYPNRPEELESVPLYDFAKWYDITKIKPMNNDIEVYDIGNYTYLKKRQRGCLVNHYRHNVNTEPEKYFHALLLLFKPWRDTDELKGNCDSYAEAFELSKLELIEALQYHERLSDIQKGFDHVKELIEQKIDNLTRQMSHLSRESDNDEHNPLGFQPIEADLAMREFVDVDGQIAEVDVNKMITELNVDQKRIFDKVITALNTDNKDEVLRLFVSGAGGTGKSFLIKTIRSWIKQILGKTTAVTAPTGLAAFNIDGLTVHRLFQLPIEHGGTPKYKELSDQVLKILRADFKDVVLFIIDEVSMISNITLTYIHLRLSEIFDTKNSTGGWFGGKHILVLGDLLQLPPVNEDSAFLNLSAQKVRKYLGSVGSVNLWSQLFAYDELLINVRQQNDSIYLQILSAVRFGKLSTDDQRILESRKIELIGESVNDRIESLCNYINELPLDTVCLFSTRRQCEVLNTAMLAKIPGEDIELTAEDSVDCIPYLKTKITKLLKKDNEDDSRTAGLAKTIIIRIGAKIMLRRNIDISLGLINGTIAHVISVTRAIDTHEVESLKIALASGTEYTIEKISTKFEIMNGAFVFRKQFPISLSYGITIHKSQGLTLKSTVMDIGNSLFTCGQAYVALSRVTSLEGLHLINLDPSSFKVQESALIEYNRLRRLYRPDLAEINISRTRNKKIRDAVWAIPLQIQNIQSAIDEIVIPDSVPTVVGLENMDGVSCYANASLQAIYHCRLIVRELIKLNNNDPLETLACAYVANKTKLTSLTVREFAGEGFRVDAEKDAAEFIMALCQKSNVLRDAIEHEFITTTRCNQCGLKSENMQPNHILAIPVAFATGIKCPKNLHDLIDSYLSRWTRIDGACENCHQNTKLQKTVVGAVKDIIVVQLILFSYQNDHATKLTNFKINAVPTTTVKLNNSKFKVNSAIFHHGENVDSGHYTAMLKDKINNWLNVNDVNVRKMIWPRGAKDAYIFFLEKIP